MEETDQKSSVPQATIDDKIFNFAYIMAMRDATQQQAFPAANKKLLWEKADETVVAYRLLKGYINDILDKDKQEQDFYEIEKDIEKAVDEFIKTNGIKKVTKKRRTRIHRRCSLHIRKRSETHQYDRQVHVHFCVPGFGQSEALRSVPLPYGWHNGG